MKKIIHGFDGACKLDGAQGFQETFSVGVFAILPKVYGEGTKRGPVRVRIKGPISNPDAVYKKAREIVDLLDAGNYSGPRTITVR